MKISKLGDWRRAKVLLSSGPRELASASRKALLEEAQFLRTEIVKGIRDQAPGGKAFKPLSPLTIALRRLHGFKGTKALMRRGDLRNSISVAELHNGIFIGVRRTAKGSDGQDLLNVAEIQEHGSRPILIKMTPRMRRLLAAAFRAAGLPRRAGGPSTGIIIVQIPPRPFLGPVFERFGAPADVKRRFEERLRKRLMGKLHQSG